MIDKSSHHGLAESRIFVPEVKPLESRLLLSQSLDVSFPDGSSVVVPSLFRLPRTGGEFTQTGSVLNIGVGQPSSNTVRVADDHRGGVTAQWNGGPAHVLADVNTTVIQMQRARNDQVTFNLTSPRTGPATVAVGSPLPQHADSVSAHAAPAVRGIRRTSGVAVQSGSVLTVTVTRPGTNTVAISNEGGGAVLVEWNGGAVHSFMGVETIVVDARNARNDLVAIHDVTH